MARLMVALLAAWLSTFAIAAQPVRPLVLAFDEVAPWKIQDGEHFSGAYTEIVRELARRAGLPLQIAACPLKRCLFMLESGSADLMIGLRATAERGRYLQFLRTPYRHHSSDKVFYVRAHDGKVIRDYADLAGLRIGIKLGADYFPRFDEDKALGKDAVGDMETNFRKLAMGRLDAVLIPEDQGEALVAQLGLKGKVTRAPYRQSDPSSRAIAIAKRSPYAANYEQFEQIMAGMVRDGTVDAIFRRYYYEANKIAPDAVQIQ